MTLQHCRIFRTAHFSHHPPSKAINMSANCATWTSERIELLKRCLHAGLSCGQTAREIGVTRNAVIGKMNRLGLSRPKDVIGRQLEQRRAARLARPKIPRTWRSKRPRLNIFAQHEMLMAAFPRLQPPAETSLSTTDADARCSSSARGNAAGRSATRAPRTSASAGTSQSKGCPIARGTRALHIGRSVGGAAARVREHTTAAAPPRGAGKLHLPRCYWKQRALPCL